MKIEGLKQGQAVWVKGYVDCNVFRDCNEFINFYNKDGNHCGHISRNNVREMKEEDVQIDQPKPVVPQFVADWYEENKDKFEEELCYQIWLIRESGAETDFEYWLTETENPIKTLINMHQFGYTVEKEKLYTVEILGNKLYKLTSDNHARYMLLPKSEPLPMSREYKFSDKLTESDVKASDERLWQWAKEVTE
ncbi:DUF1642 domain-containing protein [Streptococcus uberis]|uniref:DUF1642 domain-containing protein n=1 Tax=Streptococcus uberis TaxID=1349 RepID=UPI003D6C650F